MSIELLLDLQEAHAFDHAPLRRDLGAYHVPFHKLIPGEIPEEMLAGAHHRRSGSGKSSLIEYTLGPAKPGIAPIAVPIFAEPYNIVTKVQSVAGLIIQTLADRAELSEQLRLKALEGASIERRVSQRRGITGCAPRLRFL